MSRAVKIAAIAGNCITLQNCDDAKRLRGVERLTIYSPDGLLRTGGPFDVASVNLTHGTVIAMDPVQALIPTACAGDSLLIPRRDDAENSYDADHAALLTYLLSAVRRRDWHAVSDAANDLRVLEASKR